jgi:hypothetical protein
VLLQAALEIQLLVWEAMALACCIGTTTTAADSTATVAKTANINNILCIAIIAKYKHITSYTIIFETNQKELEFLAIY